MSLNVTNIEWTHAFGPGTGRTWNPVVGCTHGCRYCYARRQARRQRQNCQRCYDFVPHLHPERLDEPLRRRKPTGIFLGSMCDLWDPQVQQEWRDRVWDVCARTPQHQYFALTKRPDLVTAADCLPPNVLLGFSAEGQREFDRHIGSLANQVGDRETMVSIEPLLWPVSSIIGMGSRDWLIVGAETGPGAFVPPAEWVEQIVYLCRERTCPVFIKDSLRALYPGRDWPQEWPAGMGVPAQ